MQFLNLVNEIAELQRDCTINWKQNSVTLTHQDFLKLVEENHAFNYQLWLAEDRARRDDAGFEFVYKAKREIDACNQQRNNRMEAIDEWMYKKLQPRAPTECAVHSETPGMMIDRLSILTLKAYHMGLQVVRTDVDSIHQQSCNTKLQTILQQQQQLQECLKQLLVEVSTKTRTFRVYHQFKMYNDPALNPELYLPRSP